MTRRWARTTEDIYTITPWWKKGPFVMLGWSFVVALAIAGLLVMYIAFTKGCHAP